MLTWMLWGCGLGAETPRPTPVEPAPSEVAEQTPDPAPAPKPADPKPAESPLVVWSGGEQAEVAGRMAEGTWTYDHDIPEEEIRRAVRNGGITSTHGGPGTFASDVRWDCHRFVVDLGEHLDDQPVLAGSPTWNAFPRPLADHTLTDAEKARVDGVIAAQGGKGPAEIASVRRVDVDGDGQAELFASVVEATLVSRMYEDGEDARDGDYSGLVLLPGGEDGGFWVGDLQSETNQLMMVTSVLVAAVADLNGDGRLELFLRSASPSWGSRVDLYGWSDRPEQLGTVAFWGEVDCTDEPRENWGAP